MFCHRYDNYTPIEEVCRAMNRVIEDGKAYYWGTSEWQAAQIMEAHAICERLGLIKPIADQCQYSMLVRDRFEREYSTLFEKTGLGTTTWSPLMGGVLTGKYINEIPKGSRFDISSSLTQATLNEYMNNKNHYDSKLRKLQVIAKDLGVSMANLAIAWVIKNPDVSTCLLGVSRLEQLKDNMKVLDIMNLITDEIEDEINKALENIPTPEKNWRDFNYPLGRRELVVKNKL